MNIEMKAEDFPKIRRNAPRPRWYRKIFPDGFGKLPLQDHTGRIGKDILTIEPYGFGNESIRELLDFCDEHELEFHINGCSIHRTGDTVLIQIKPRISAERFFS